MRTCTYARMVVEYLGLKWTRFLMWDFFCFFLACDLRLAWETEMAIKCGIKPDLRIYQRLVSCCLWSIVIIYMIVYCLLCLSVCSLEHLHWYLNTSTTLTSRYCHHSPCPKCTCDVRYQDLIMSCMDKLVVINMYCVCPEKNEPLNIFRLDAWALSVIATATWLAGWVAGCPSHSGIVSKRLNVSENFFDHLKAPSF